MIYYLVYLGVMSLISVIIYKADKSKAQKGKWRIKESVLLGIGFIGGAIGALLGMQIFHHKTKHWYFYAVNIAGLILQLGILYYFFIR